MKQAKLHRFFFIIFAGLMLSLNLTSAQQTRSVQPSSNQSQVDSTKTWRDFEWGKTFCDPTLSKTPDLSGEYKNVVFYAEKGAPGLSGKLTIKEDNRNFELVTASGTRTGTLTATTSCGYTAIALQFKDGPDSQVFTLRARKIGSAEGFDLESLESDKPIILASTQNQATDFALLVCPETYPACWPYRNRCPCEKPQL